MADLFADEHIPPQITFKLRLLGHQVRQVRELSASKEGDGWTDEVVLQQASIHGAAVLMRNATDFRNLHESTNHNHSGIIVVVFHDTEDMKRVAKRIDAAIRAAHSLRCQLITVPSP